MPHRRVTADERSAARSYLYVPGNDHQRLARATARGADAVIVDLEDAVVASGKDDARASAAQFVRTAGGTGHAVWVRVNRGDLGIADIAGITGAGLAGICVPKVDTAEELSVVDTALRAAEHRADLPAGSVPVIPLIESAAGVEELRAICRSPRVRSIQIGEADLGADLALEPSLDGHELLAVRSAVVVASRAAGIAAPIAAVSTNFRDLDALRSDTELLRGLGFYGRACIHPAQVAVVHAVFTPSAAEVARARALVASFDDAVARGLGVMVGPDGRMLDEALVRRARDLLARRPR